MHRKGVQRIGEMQMSRAASGLQRGNTPESSQVAQRHTEEITAALRVVYFHSAKGRNSVLQGTELCKRQQMEQPFPTEIKNKYQHFFPSLNDAWGCYV